MIGETSILCPLYQYAYAHQPNLTISPRFVGILVARRGTAPVRGVACNDMNWHEYFTYNAETGKLIWKVRPRSFFSTDRSCNAWNTRYAKRVVGADTCYGDGIPKCTITSVNDRKLKVHRIIWEMINGAIPVGMVIDHIDGNPFNNRIENMRMCSQGQNLCNKRIQSNNSCGIKGVCYSKVMSSWEAKIMVNGKKTHLGYFNTAEEAGDAYAKGANSMHGEYARTS